MADAHPTGTAAPAAPGFKLKLKLGGAGAGPAAGAGGASSVGPIASPVASTSGSRSGNSKTGQTLQEQQIPPLTYQNLPSYQHSDLSPAPDDGSDDMDEDELDDFRPEDIGDDGTYITKKNSKKKASTTPAPMGEGDPSLTISVGSAGKKRPTAPSLLPGVGRAWRKGMKGYSRPEGLGELTPPPGGKRRRPNYAEDGVGDDEGGDEFLPTMVAPGAIATSDKWQNGLPGGNEQSRATAAMASAVNKAFPVGQPPKVPKFSCVTSLRWLSAHTRQTGSGFLIAQPLDKNTPRPRSWKKAKREILGTGGVPFLVTVYVGGKSSELFPSASLVRLLPI